MQVATKCITGMIREPLPEECVTFQVALIGSDGLVVASDRRVSHMSVVAEHAPAFQFGETDKFYKSKHESVVCFYAGSDTARDAALAITLKCEPKESTTEVEWISSVREAATVGIGLPPTMGSDQIFVVRRDVADGLWLVARGSGPAHAPGKITDRFCTGDNSPARFLPLHLWNTSLRISELKNLALLTLACAAEENPSGVAAPFDVMTLSKAGQFEWSRHDSSETLKQEFDRQLKKLFAGLCNADM